MVQILEKEEVLYTYYDIFANACNNTEMSGPSRTHRILRKPRIAKHGYFFPNQHPGKPRIAKHGYFFMFKNVDGFQSVQQIDGMPNGGNACHIARERNGMAWWKAGASRTPEKNSSVDIKMAVRVFIGTITPDPDNSKRDNDCGLDTAVNVCNATILQIRDYMARHKDSANKHMKKDEKEKEKENQQGGHGFRG
eukprot:jgi/Psemu1/33959/gm1.33959_g